MQILHSLERQALALRTSHPVEAGIWIDDMRPAVELPVDRRMFRPPVRVALEDVMPQEGEAESDASALYSLSVVDRKELFDHIAFTLSEQKEVTLRELTLLRPMRHGLAELLTYLDLGSSRFQLLSLDFMQDTIPGEVKARAMTSSEKLR